MSSAMPSFRRECGIDVVSCIALLALRMRVNMSATGSVSIGGSFQLPSEAMGQTQIRGTCDSIFHGDYHELFVMPGMTPWWASSRRQIRQSPNFLKTARGRPHLLQ